MHEAQASSLATEQRLQARVDRLRSKKVGSEPVGCVGGVGMSTQGSKQRMEMHVVAALWVRLSIHSLMMFASAGVLSRPRAHGSPGPSWCTC